MRLNLLLGSYAFSLLNLILAVDWLKDQQGELLNIAFLNSIWTGEVIAANGVNKHHIMRSKWYMSNCRLDEIIKWVGKHTAIVKDWVLMNYSSKVSKQINSKCGKIILFLLHTHHPETTQFEIKKSNFE
jgi:hypothetical protein